MPVFLPPDTAATGVVPAARHIGKDRLRHFEIHIAVRHVVRLYPREPPPALIVVKVVDKTSDAVSRYRRSRFALSRTWFASSRYTSSRDRQPQPRRSLRSEEHTSELQSPCNLVCR